MIPSHDLSSITDQVFVSNFHKTKLTKSDISRRKGRDFAEVSVSCVILQYWLLCSVALLLVAVEEVQIVSYSEQINQNLTTPGRWASFPWFCHCELLQVTSKYLLEIFSL